MQWDIKTGEELTVKVIRFKLSALDKYHKEHAKRLKALMRVLEAQEGVTEVAEEDEGSGD